MKLGRLLNRCQRIRLGLLCAWHFNWTAFQLLGLAKIRGLDLCCWEFYHKEAPLETIPLYNIWRNIHIKASTVWSKMMMMFKNRIMYISDPEARSYQLDAMSPICRRNSVVVAWQPFLFKRSHTWRPWWSLLARHLRESKYMGKIYCIFSGENGQIYNALSVTFEFLAGCSMLITDLPHNLIFEFSCVWKLIKSEWWSQWKYNSPDPGVIWEIPSPE